MTGGDGVFDSADPDGVFAAGGAWDLTGVKDTPAYKAIMARHLFGSVRTDAGVTLRQAHDLHHASQSDHPGAEAAGGVRWGGFDDLDIGSLITQLRAMGFDVDAQWLLEAAAHHLPTERTLPHD